MTIKTQDKSVHIFGFFAASILFFVVVFFFPTLLKDASTSLGTIGTFVTVYGVFFAIIELGRAKTASLIAREEAERVFRAVTSLVEAREIVECQSTINVALASLDEGRAIASSVLSQICKLYSSVFHPEFHNERSEHRLNRSTLQAYAFNSTKPGKSPKTRKALLSIVSHLGELQGSTKNFTEYMK